MSFAEDFAEITRQDAPLAPLTWLKVGGPAQFLVEPRNREELAAVVRACRDYEMPLHLLGEGSNLLIRDVGVSGVVLRLPREPFAAIEIDGSYVRCGCAARLTQVISASVRAGLAGLEVLAGIPGTVGGALHGNAGGRQGDIGRVTRHATVMTGAGEIFERSQDELQFGYRQSSLDEIVILDASFDLSPGEPAEIARRMKKIWISKKTSQPYAFQSAGCVFRNPRGKSAGTLIDRAGLKGTRVGGAAISERHANFIVTEPGATADDVLRLIDLARFKISEQFGVDLEMEVQVW